MTKWDKEYIKLCKKILKKGVVSQNRTGIDTIKIPEYTFKLDVGKEYPVLTTKKLYFKKAILEMMWIYQAKSNDVRWLQDRDIHIWDEWEIKEDGKWYATQNVMENGKYVKKDIVKNFGEEYAHTIGTAYGYIVNKFNLIDNIIKTIKENPQDRRMVMSLWQNDYLDTAVLPSCVWSSEWDVTNGKLNAWVHQRSCDVPLGLPFNVTQYATLLCMIAHVTNLKPGTLSWSIKDAQIYVNQIDGIKQQIKRFDEGKVFDAPKLWLNPKIKDFFEFDNSKDLKDIKIIGYESEEPIKFQIAQ